MREETAQAYRCPRSAEPLCLEVHQRIADEIVAGELCSASGHRYAIRDAVPQLIDFDAETFTDEQIREFEYYESNSGAYDRVIEWLFESFYEDENRIRESMVDLLSLRPGDRVLETGCGTCRDSIRIAQRIGPEGTLFLQDLSPGMLGVGRRRMRVAASNARLPKLEFFVGNAVRLPFPDGYFDACFHFGGLNLFDDKVLALREMSRVTRRGGKVVAGDESVAPWLISTTYGKVLRESNHLYRFAAPIESLPENAREVCVRWLIGNAFYVIDFKVGDGPPRVDLDKPIRGARGGTLRTRYFGQVEGVTPEAKEMIRISAEKAGLSLHEWLDRAVRNQFTAEQ